MTNPYEKMRQHLPDELVDIPVVEGRFALMWTAISMAPPGVWAEFGVGGGESARWLEKRRGNDFTLHLFDSFEGLPEPWEREDAPGGAWPAGRHKAHIYEALNADTRVNIGEFMDTVPGYFSDFAPTLSFVHIDCDLYSSTKTVLKWIEDSLLTDAIIMFDELFGYPNYENHEYKALNEWGRDFEYVARDNEWRAVIKVL